MTPSTGDQCLYGFAQAVGMQGLWLIILLEAGAQHRACHQHSAAMQADFTQAVDEVTGST